MKNTQKDLLKLLDLSDFEIELFLLLKKNLDLNISKLAKTLGSNRVKIYSGLDSLTKKDLLTIEE